MRGETSLSRLKVSLFKMLGELPLAEYLNFMLDLEELREMHYAFQCWWSSLKHPPYTNISENTFNLVLPCIFSYFVLQISSWTHTYPFGLSGECCTPNPLWVGVECEQPPSPRDHLEYESKGRTNVI